MMTLAEYIAERRFARLARRAAGYRNRSASLKYRPIGRSREPYPDWIRELRDKSGVYVIRDRASREVLYVGESHGDNLYKTLTRHFQTVRHEAQEVPMT
jgi:hypothetical protein